MPRAVNRADGGPDQQPEPTLHAVCSNCNDVHPVADRPSKRGTTACPACGALGYTSESHTEGVQKPKAERIADAVRDVDGVGPETRDRIVDAFPHYHAFRAAGVDELREIEGVGKTIAREIARGP